MAKQFIKKILIATCMTVFLVVIASMTYAYVVPAILSADIPGTITSGIGDVNEKTKNVATIFIPVTDQLSNIHKDNMKQTDTKKVQTNQDLKQIDNRKQLDADPPNYSKVKSGTVTKIIDGDTLDIDGTRIRLTLVNTPEYGKQGYTAATVFTREQCPIGTTALYDADDGQKEGSYGRVIGKVWCIGHPVQSPDYSLNSQLIQNGHANVFSQFCGTSEFGKETWAKQSGC
jgi:endonuclease YncB( thermonuclease family)